LQVRSVGEDVHGLPFCLSREHHNGVPLLCTARSAFTGEGEEMQIRNRPPRDSIRNHFYVPSDESCDSLGSSRKRGEGSGAQLMKNILLLAFSVILSLSTLPSALSVARTPAKSGWVPLFNGKDLTGWKNNG